MRINAQLIDSKTGDIFKSFQKDGHTENIIDVIDSLSAEIRNFLRVTVLQKTLKYQKYVSSNSPEALKYFIYGQNAFFKLDFKTAREWALKAIEIDSNFVMANIMLASTYGDYLYNSYNDAYQQKKMTRKLYEMRDKMSRLDKLNVEALYAGLFQTPVEMIKYTNEFLEIDDQQPGYYREFFVK